MRNMPLFACLWLISVAVGRGQTAILESVVPAMEKAEVPGLSLAIIDNGEITTYSYGVKEANKEAEVTHTTRFEAASLTKPVFAYAVLKLVDQGLLELDTPLDAYWQSPEVDAGEWPGVITARMVLTHSTGFPNWRSPRNAKKVKVGFEPGSRFSYSGEGFVYLSKVLEKVTGKPTHVYVSELVFEPLEMSHSSMIWSAVTAAACATPHNITGEPQSKYHPESANAAASLHTTAADYARFVQAIAAGTGLSAASHRLMTTPQQNVDPTCSQCKKPNRHPDFKDVRWALGIGMEHAEEDYLWHWGDNGNFKAYVCYSLTSGKGLVFFANGHGGLALRDILVGAVLPGSHPAHEWVSYTQVSR